MPILAGELLGPGVTQPADWRGVEMTWTGSDGSVWQLLDAASQVTLEAVRGLHLPEWDRYTSTPAGLVGSRHRGSRTAAREVWWVVAVHSRAGTQDWLNVDRSWWHSISVDDPGVWAVTTLGQTRRLSLRLGEAPDDLARDPTLTGEAAYALTFEAGQPYWEGDPVVRSFTNEAPSPFFIDAGAGIFFISRSRTLDSASVTNSGDVPAWPVWTVTGPCTDFSVGVDGKTIDADITLLAGESVVIDTRPDQQTVIDSTGADRVGDITAAAWAPVPAGQSVPLDLTVTGAGAGSSVTASLTPLYRRAW